MRTMSSTFRYLLTCGIALVLFIAIVFFVLSLQGCGVFRQTKTTTAVHDSVTVHDTVTVTNMLHDSLVSVVRDTVIGEPGRDITTFVHDTVIRNHNVKLIVHGGFIDCSADSLTLVIKDLESRTDYVTRERDSLRDVVAKSTTLTAVVKTETDGWFVRFARYVVDFWAIVGIVFAIGWMVPLVVKRFA